MIIEQVKSIQGLEASRRTTELRGTAAEKTAVPETAGFSADPEVAEKASRRRFTAEYKIQILREADACTAPGSLDSLLRREGLYSSNLTTWRTQRDRGLLKAFLLRSGDARMRSAILLPPRTRSFARRMNG